MNNIRKNIGNFVFGIYLMWVCMIMASLFGIALYLLLVAFKESSLQQFGYSMICWGLLGGMLGVLTNGFES